MINELCLYRIREGKMQPFLDRFRDHASRLMEAHGFTIEGAWETEEEDAPAFAYLLAWEDEAAMTSGWKAFRADPEWSEAKARTGTEHGRLIADIRQWTLRPTAFSSAIGDEF